MTVPRSKCAKHGENLAYFCYQCRDRFCGDCIVLDSHSPYHHIERMQVYADKEKEKLQAKMKETTQMLEDFIYSQSSLEDKSREAELKWLMLKDHIRQEFVSFHEMLIDKEKELLQLMDEAVTDTVCDLEILVADRASLDREEAQLAQTCVSTLQLHCNLFLQKLEEKMKSLEEFQEKIRQMENRTKNVLPEFLSQPFSLYKEKKHLHDSLGFENFGKPHIKPHNLMLEVPVGTKSLPLTELFSAPSTLPPSTFLRYCVSVHGNGGKHLLSNPRVKPTDCILFGFCFVGDVFLLKVTPVYIQTSNHSLRRRIMGHTERIYLWFTRALRWNGRFSRLDCVPMHASRPQQESLQQKTRFTFPNRHRLIRALSQRNKTERTLPNNDQEFPNTVEGRWHVHAKMMENTSFEEERWTWYQASHKHPPAEEKPVTPPAPVADLPVKPVPVAELPVKPAPVAELPIKSTPVADLPVKPTPVADLPVKPTPVADLPVKPTSVAELPVKPTPIADLPVKPTSVAELPMPVKPVPARKGRSSWVNEFERFHILRGMLEEIIEQETLQ